MGKVIFEKGQYKYVPDRKKGVPSYMGVLKGKVIKTSAKTGYFIQVDKNGQINDIFLFNRSFPADQRIREKVRGPIFDNFKGRPLFSAFKELCEILPDWEEKA